MKRVAILIGVFLIVGLLPAGQAGSTPGTGGDCGGPDTPPAYQLASGVTCDGSHDEAATTTTDLTEMQYRESLFVDRFDIAATDGDRVQIDSTTRVCFVTEPAGSFVASGNGNIGITVTARQTFELGTSTPKNPCPVAPGSYTIRATITPNDRPTSVSASGVPASVRVGESFTFTVSGTDPDGNLKDLGVGSSSSIDWKQPALGSGGSVQFTYQMWNDMRFKVYARDTFGAVTESATSYVVELDQDDCGFSRDADSEPVALPFACVGYLSPSSGDDTDSFSFVVPSGLRPHATFINGNEWGQSLKLTSPSGVEIVNGGEEIFGTLEAGTWSLAVRGDGDSVFYQLAIDLIGPQAAPSLTVSAGSTAHQGDLFPVDMRAVDPNGERIEFLIEWSDGSGSYWPVNATAASGETVRGYRRFLSNASSLTATIRAINAEGLMSEPESIDVQIRPHNDCGLGIRFDLPAASGPLSVVQTPCSGTLGGGLLEYPYPIDIEDAFVSPKRCAIGSCKLRVTLTTEAGLAAYLVAETLPEVQQTSSSCGAGGCTTTMDLLATYPTASYPRISLRRSAGAGGYAVSVDQVTLTNGLI